MAQARVLSSFVSNPSVKFVVNNQYLRGRLPWLPGFAALSHLRHLRFIPVFRFRVWRRSRTGVPEEFHIRMALHNHPKTWPPDDVLKACEGHSKLIGSCSDTGHWMRRDLVPVEQFKKLEGRVEHSHFKDLDEYGTGHDLPWGTGKGDVKGMLAELKRQNYKGCVSIEYEVGTVQDLDENLPKCVAYFDSVLKDLAGADK